MLVPVVAGFALGVACTGADAALVAHPVSVIVFGLLAAVLAVAGARRERRHTAFAMALGAAAAFALPRIPPDDGAVRTAFAPRGRLHVLRGNARPGESSGGIFALLDELDRDPRRLLGARITVFGEWLPATPGRDASVSRRVMTCCAADAIRVGFDVRPEHVTGIARNAPACVSGELHSQVRDGELRYVIEHALVRPACSGAAISVRKPF